MHESRSVGAEGAVAPAADRLSIELLRRKLTTDVIGHHVYVFGTVDSTNRVLHTLAARGAREGTVVLAERQTAGRGRHGHAWFSPEAANLYISVLFRPTFAVRELAMFAPIASLALVEAIWCEGAPARIQWPNNVVVGGRKVGGVLVETVAAGDGIAHVILGVGVNLNVDRPALEAALGPASTAAASLHEVVGREIDRNAFAASWLNRLDKWHRTFLTRGPSAVVAAWRGRDTLRGRRLEIRTETENWTGWGRGIDADGALLVEDDGGRTHRVLSGGVRLVDRAPDEVLPLPSAS
jgi:BirA family biotin operon repressor/biotin-[acetyl-CoA-carboxylase] ligase